MFGQIFCSPQKKRSVTINSKYGIYELRHEFPNDLRLRMLRILTGKKHPAIKL